MPFVFSCPHVYTKIGEALAQRPPDRILSVCKNVSESYSYFGGLFAGFHNVNALRKYHFDSC